MMRIFQDVLNIDCPLNAASDTIIKITIPHLLQGLAQTNHFIDAINMGDFSANTVQGRLIR